jgi:hypothetical protein
MILDRMRKASCLPPDDVRSTLQAIVPEYRGHESDVPREAIAGRVGIFHRAA